MAFTNEITGVRTSSVQTVPFNFTMADLPTVGNISNESFYLPITAKDTLATPFTLVGLTVVSNTATFTPSIIDFAKLRVGDVISAVTGGTVTIPISSTLSRTAHVYHSQNFVLFTGSNSLPKRGDSISGTGIAISATVVRVDITTRIVYLSLPNTESSLFASPVSVTVTPLVRILSLVSATGIVTLSSNFAGTGTDVATSIAFTPGLFDAIMYDIEGTHTRDGNTMTASFKIYKQTGLLAYDGLGTGSDATTIASVSSVQLGSFTLNTDDYFVNARVARTAS